MKLSQKIKHIKRHRKNKHLKDKAETILWLAITDIKRHNSDRFFIVSPLMYEIIRYYHLVPDNLKCSDFVKEATGFMMTVPTDIYEFYNRNEADYIKECCGIFYKEPDEKTKEELSKLPFSMFTNPELYMHIDKPIAPDVSACIKEI